MRILDITEYIPGCGHAVGAWAGGEERVGPLVVIGYKLGGVAGITELLEPEASGIPELGIALNAVARCRESPAVCGR